jgi:signal transduction histidine kinase
LGEKSGRLKHLIEDLIEASKASSGNLTVNSVKVDLNELALQACGEYEEKLHSPEQLTERFVRGDVARTTEGSGLGLSIAQSLTNILGGRFKIEIDGDLFKVIVEIPLWAELQSDGKIT